MKTSDENCLAPFCYSTLTEAVKDEDKNRFYTELEHGKVVLFPRLSFVLEQNERKFLTSDTVNGSRKNVSFDAKKDRMHGDSYQNAEHEALKAMLKRFNQFAIQVIQTYFPQYVSSLEVGRTSFRPVEAATRENLSYRKDDRRLHVDAFPASPNYGKRILRLFSNINPENKDRVWRVGEDFSMVAKYFNVGAHRSSRIVRKLMHILSITRGFRSDYDDLMLYLHDKMKADQNYQENCQQKIVELPAGSTWIVFTDQVSHAAMMGQHCLEQTFYLPVGGQCYPECSPLKVLENLTGRVLV